jgi:hypothetical protein
MGLLRPQYAKAKSIGLLLQLLAGSQFEAKGENPLFPMSLSPLNFLNTYQAM